MSPNETIEFTCPHCMTNLKVPASLAGITGPCPNCQTSITAPYLSPEVDPPIIAEHPQTTDTQYQEKPDPSVVTPQNSSRLESPPIPATPVYKKTSDTPKHRDTTKQEVAQPSRSRRPEPKPTQSYWPGAAFPLLFLLLAAAVVYLILDLMGILNLKKETQEAQKQGPTPAFNPNDKDTNLLPASSKETLADEHLGLEVTPAISPVQNVSTQEPELDLTAIPELTPDTPTPVPSETPVPPKPFKHADQDIQKDGEILGDLPDISQQNLSSEERIKRRTAAITEAGTALKQFLTASNYNSRKSLITNSKHEATELSSSFISKPFPRTLEPLVYDSKEKSEDRSFEVFFTVAFEQANEEREKIVTIRTLTYSDKTSPKIDIDLFLDLYNENVRDFSEKNQEGTGTFDSIIEFSSYCFDDIPRASKMAKVSFYGSFSAIGDPMTTAYLNKESSSFKTLKALSEKKRFLAKISVAWETEIDPKRPFLQVIRVEKMDWNL